MKRYVHNGFTGLAMALTLSGSVFASAQIIVNPGFETPALGNGNFSYNTPGATWVFLTYSGISNNNSGFTSLNPPAPQGTQVAFLQGTGSFSQDVAGFQSGNIYTLTFQADQRLGGSLGSGYFNRQNFAVQLDGVTLSAFQPLTTAYTPFSTASFTTTSGTHNLRFLGLDTVGGDNTAFIDNLVLQNVRPNNVPEPGSVALLVGMTTTGAGFLVRKRRARK